MAVEKRNTEPMELFDAQLAIERLGSLFKYIRTQLIAAEEEAGYVEGAEAYFAAIDALTECGMRDCADLDRRLTATWQAQRAAANG